MGSSHVKSIKATPEIALISTANAKFANKIYKILSKKSSSANIFFSPLSVHAVLSLVYEGAGGTTAESLASALNLSDKLSTAQGYNGVINTLHNINHVTLQVANKIFVADRFPLKAEFKKTTFDLFLSEVEMVNFNESEESASIINQWVEDKTNSKIKNIITSECVNGLTCVVLVNAVYFKGDWADQFHKLDTRTRPFHITKNQKVDCQMMHITKKYMYRNDRNLDAQILEIPYGKKDVSMVVILPNAVDGMEALETKLFNVDLSKLTEGMRYVKVMLYLPKFKMEVNMDFESILTKMGMGEIFNLDKADFSEMSDSSESLYISQVVQKAFIEVNEEGSEAAAISTAVGIEYGMSTLSPPTFNADHPFVIILTTKWKTILFYGKLMNPQENN